MKMVKKSLARQLTATIVALVAGTVLLCWFLNNTFLEGYYTYNKQEVMLDGFAIINRASEQGILDNESFDVAFENSCSNDNMSIIVICADGSVIQASVNDVEHW